MVPLDKAITSFYRMLIVIICSGLAAILNANLMPMSHYRVSPITESPAGITKSPRHVDVSNPMTKSPPLCPLSF